MAGVVLPLVRPAGCHLRALRVTACCDPRNSNHGWGKAIDIDDAVGADGNPLYGFGTPGYIWMVANGPRFGWVAPDWALQNGGNPEPWHFEYVR